MYMGIKNKTKKQTLLDENNKELENLLKDIEEEEIYELLERYKI